MSTPKFSNGVDATTGDYLPAPASLKDLATNLLQGRPLGKDYENNADFELADDADTQDLGSTGWGVIFAEGADPAIREALSPILRLRETQASTLFEGYREFWGPLAYRKGQTQEDFLAQWERVTDGLVDPTLMPYYLLLVGGPEEISFEFQYEMDVAYAVGRIHFDTPEEYARYAETIVAAEQRRHSKRATIFGVGNGNDTNTCLLLKYLLLPVLERLVGNHPTWVIEQILGQDASKKRLVELLAQPPSLLFTAGHGVVFPKGDPRQVAEQGAVVCSEWIRGGQLPPDFYFSASDVESDADLAGMIIFQFACCSAATPGQDDFHGLEGIQVPSDRPFIASLPKRLLGLPGGRGALAVIGHVDRIWTYSFFNEETNAAENLVFEQCLSRLLKGHRVGYALEYFNRWHANYAVRLTNMLFKRDQRKEAIDEQRLARTWLINNDARNYILLGDPAVRLEFQESGTK